VPVLRAMKEGVSHCTFRGKENDSLIACLKVLFIMRLDTVLCCC
jgi:hypothetical protein